MKLQLALCLVAALTAFGAPAVERPPNVVIVFADDLGYGDLASFGSPSATTPNLDRLAREGRRFTSFYSAQAVCSASRAALLTGCYPNRIGIHGALGPGSKIGLHSHEVTMAELLREKGYATTAIGKWHLGHHPQFLPTRHGFDSFYGLPYSNDMWPFHPEAKPGTYPPLPLIEGEKVIETNPDQSRLTTEYTRRSVQFIEQHKDRPFFLYLAHSMPHVPLFVSDQMRSSTGHGLYADVIAEIDWSVGQILDVLERHHLSRNTIVIFTSDNGPWLSYGNHSGSSGSLREGKGTAWEGGVRVPCIIRWPRKIPAGTTSVEPLMTIDLLPTIARLADARLPDHQIDGKDVWPIISGSSSTPHPHQAYFFYYNQNELHAVRSGQWKLIAPHQFRSLAGMPGGTNGIPAKYQMFHTDWALYDLSHDPGETTDLGGTHPQVVERLQKLMDAARADLGDRLQNRLGQSVREPGLATSTP